MRKMQEGVGVFCCGLQLTAFSLGLICAGLALVAAPALSAEVKSNTVLQRTGKLPVKQADGGYYVPSSLSTMRWGILPNNQAKPILTVPSGSVITFDTLSSEGMVEDQGRDPVKFFGKFGVKPADVLDDAIEICASSTEHNMVTDGPHIIIGPVAIEGAKPGDVLKVETLSLVPRVPYGIVGNRHGKGALPGEFPQNDGPKPGANKEHPELFGNVFTFVPVEHKGNGMYGIMHTASGKEVTFPLSPFMGTMGVAPNTSNKVSSIPPSTYGGNLDLKDLGPGSALYLPIELEGGMFFIGDPHFSQGDGEVALTALEASLRSKLRLTLLKAGDPAIPAKGTLDAPFAETPDLWIPIGLDPDLSQAMKKTVRASIKFLVDKMGMDSASAMAYLSVATDFEITQVVDITKGCHAHIRKSDFATVTNASGKDKLK